MSIASEFAVPRRAAAPRRPAERRLSGTAAARSSHAFGRMLFCLAAAGADALVVVGVAFASSLAYQGGPMVWDTVSGGVILAILFLFTAALTAQYDLPIYLARKGRLASTVKAWVTTFAVAETLCFFTKTSAFFSRGTTAIQFVAGFALLVAVRGGIAWLGRRKVDAGGLSARSILLVGAEREIQHFLGQHRPETCGLRVVGACVLRDTADNLDDDLALAVASARVTPPDEVFLLVPWTDEAVLARCVDSFRRLPCDIHLGPSALLERFGTMRIEHAGSIRSVHLVRAPLTSLDLVAKRVFDVVLAATALLGLSPLLLLAALAIKLESRGPVFFTQRRYGFNQEPFRIVKFRSMTTMEDNAALRQVTTGDRRVTRVGRILRKTSIDELPQLLNVLRGDMSIVGPRPHALAHDQQFERTIASYAKRHNVRPGITGWAQVSGWRGETDTPEKIQGRIAHDFHYIDNWSFWFDLSIILRTMFSPRTFQNAK